MASRLFSRISPISLKTFIKWPARLKSNIHVVMTDDSSTIVCWHPETTFPYEMSKPIPQKLTEKSDSILKVQSNKELLNTLKPKTELETAQELSKLTFTTKHRWFPIKRIYRSKPRIEADRPYL